MYSVYNKKQNRIGPATAVAVVVFFLTLSALNSIGFVPSYIDGINPHSFTPVEERLGAENNLALSDLPQLGNSRPYAPVSHEAPIKPERIVAHTIGLDLPVLNPEQTSISVLDEALLHGTVRYPLSAELNQEGNLFIFGHSSSLPIIKNQMFKAFNHISALREGDMIKLIGNGKSYMYRVREVRRADANEELIDLSRKAGRQLTLSTCDSFGGKSSRFVVTADFVSSYQGVE